jgi:hypothetical protein
MEGVAMGKLQVVTRDEFEVDNLEEVKERLEAYNLHLFDLIGNIRSALQVGEFNPFYVLVVDNSDPENGYVDCPDFYLTQDQGDHGSVVYGPISWKWTDGDQYIENWKQIHKVSLDKA